RKALTCSAMGGLLVTGAAAAEAPRVENRCPRLSPSGYEELNARVQLLLRSEGEEQTLPVVVCDERTANVLWKGKLLPIEGSGPIEDEVVDLIEAELHREHARSAQREVETTAVDGDADADPNSDDSNTPARARPPAQRADPRAKRADDARGGGLLLGFELEPQAKEIGIAMGPSFDFAAPAGPVVLGVREAFRVAGSDPTIVLVDLQASIGIGAPYEPAATFGVVARFGAEWMIAYPSGNSDQTAVAPMLAVGWRVAHAFSPLSIWAGLDGQFRLSTLSLRTPGGSIEAKDVTASVTVGVAYVDWSRK
ncbi:MAG TPA: hypothetical protein VIW29_17035, partial [Polyangiaceae bacterium]